MRPGQGRRRRERYQPQRRLKWYQCSYGRLRPILDAPSKLPSIWLNTISGAFFSSPFTMINPPCLNPPGLFLRHLFILYRIFLSNQINSNFPAKNCFTLFKYILRSFQCQSYCIHICQNALIWQASRTSQGRADKPYFITFKIAVTKKPATAELAKAADNTPDFPPAVKPSPPGKRNHQGTEPQ